MRRVATPHTSEGRVDAPSFYRYGDEVSEARVYYTAPKPRNMHLKGLNDCAVHRPARRTIFLLLLQVVPKFTVGPIPRSPSGL